jgi:hypothetical protein
MSEMALPMHYMYVNALRSDIRTAVYSSDRRAHSWVALVHPQARRGPSRHRGVNQRISQRISQRIYNPPGEPLERVVGIAQPFLDDVREVVREHAGADLDSFGREDRR